MFVELVKINVIASISMIRCFPPLLEDWGSGCALVAEIQCRTRFFPGSLTAAAVPFFSPASEGCTFSLSWLRTLYRLGITLFRTLQTRELTSGQIVPKYRRMLEPSKVRAENCFCEEDWVLHDVLPVDPVFWRGYSPVICTGLVKNAGKVVSDPF